LGDIDAAVFDQIGLQKFGPAARPCDDGVRPGQGGKVGSAAVAIMNAWLSCGTPQRNLAKPLL
jgi:hypothetical protein